MSVDLSNSTLKVFRDEEDNYYTFLTGTIFNTDTKESEGKFYSKRKIKFADGEVKNKSKIKVLDGFASPYRLKIKNESGIYTYSNGEMYYIRKFELLEDGIEEKQKAFKFSQKQSQGQPQAKKEITSKADEKLSSFSFNEYSDIPPF